MGFLNLKSGFDSQSEYDGKRKCPKFFLEHFYLFWGVVDKASLVSNFTLAGGAGSLLLGSNVAHVNPLDIVATLGMDLNTHQVVSRVGAVALAH